MFLEETSGQKTPRKHVITSLSFIRSRCSSLPLWLLLSLSCVRTLERPEISGQELELYLCRRRGDPQSLSFCWQDAWDGWTGNLCHSEHSAQNRAEVNELLCGSILHLSLCMVISPLVAVMDWSGVCVCV